MVIGWFSKEQDNNIMNKLSTIEEKFKIIGLKGDKTRTYRF